MTHMRRLVSAACLALAFIDCSVSNAQTITSYNIGDDGYANVPLPFTFPYYGQQFTNSWMYDNGIVSFKQPGTAGAISPWQWSAQQMQYTGGSYFIAPLWADVAPKQGVTSYTSTTDGTYMKYSWNNLAEYYSVWGATPRLNTFSLTIKPDGTFNATYTGVNLQTSNISVGYVGDPTKGEFNQVFSAQYGTHVTSISDWSGVGGTPLPPPPPPGPTYPAQCDTNALYSTSCPGYAAALAQQTAQASVTPIASTSVVETSPTITLAPTTTTTSPTTTTTVSEPIATTPAASSPTPVASASVTQSAPVISPTPSVSNPQPKVGEVAQSSAPKTSGPSMSMIMSIVSSEQSRVSAVEKSAVQNAVSEASAAAQAAQQQAESFAATLTAQSVAGSMATTGNVAQTRGYQAPMASITNSAPGAFSVVNVTQQRQDQQGYTPPIVYVPEVKQIAIRQDDVNKPFATVGVKPYTPPSATATADQAIKKEEQSITDKMIIAPQVALQADVSQQKIGPAVKKDTPDNDAAGAVGIASIAKQPAGYDLYMIALKDTAFYPPKEIYKSQKVVDNVRAQRLLNGASDKLHEQLINTTVRK